MSKFNYFQNITVDVADFPATPQSDFNFVSIGFSFLNTGANTIQYSFNGVDVHGDLNPANLSKQQIFESRLECKVWFRYVGGSSTVRVESWGSHGRTR